ncbi:MAG: (Fe-S)-binding protein [Chloroflexota bacterium]|nr:(Fe-S)-binding protein [Chloroflexota bacterium]
MPDPIELEGDAITINDALWERLIDLTDGAASLCYQCGTCTATCPWGEVRQQPLSVREFIRMAQLGLHDGSENLWLCTTCGQCHVTCPRGVDICQVFRSLRTIAWEDHTVEVGLPSLLWSEFWNGNPWTQPPSQRTAWMKNLSIPKYNPDKHEILLYVGCTSSYDPRAQKIAQALVKVLDAAGVRFGYLGEDEPCCGEAVLSVGHQPYFAEIAENTTHVFQENGVAALVTISPHCYDVFKNHYPVYVGRNTILPYHYTQYLALLIEQGRLSFASNQTNSSGENTGGITDTTQSVTVTFQDPCYLGRHNDEYDAPRQVLNAIPGLELVEMHNHKQFGLCCGGGGGRMWLETAPGERFSDLRVVEAIETSAETLVTACPFCAVCLEDSVKALPSNKLPVMDVAEIAAAALTR